MYDINAVARMSAGDLRMTVKDRDNWRKLIMNITIGLYTMTQGDLVFVYLISFVTILYYICKHTRPGVLRKVIVHVMDELLATGCVKAVGCLRCNVVEVS